MEIESEQEIEHVCPKCKYRWTTVEIVVVKKDLCKDCEKIDPEDTYSYVCDNPPDPPWEV